MAPDDPTMPHNDDPASPRFEDPATTVMDPLPGEEDLTPLARRPDLTSLVAGIALMALGALLVLESEDVLDLSLGYLWPALLAAVGAVLLASGLRRRRDY
jgi:Domain of unknown function (DUF5668)